jgi:polysaccharide export outer membrane protein
MTIRQAIAIAGDFTARASRNKVFVIKEDDASNSSTKTPLDERVSPGDVITVKESFF